jgi:DNA-binding transcriptional regulator PaaX
MDFRKKYPLSAREAVSTPMILRCGTFTDGSLPYPSLNGIRDFAAYCGIRDGAVRTALSRAHAEGAVRIYLDSGKVVRYRLVESRMEMGLTVSGRQNRPEGFIIAVFSFATEEEPARAKVRETLKYYGFKKLAQNTYINGRIETAGLKKVMRAFGLEKNLYLFDCPSVDDADLIEKILSVFEIGKRNRFLQKFHRDLADFLEEKNLDAEEIVHRMYYAGPVHWTICRVDEPPFPPKYLPADYPLDSILRLYEGMLRKHGKTLVTHYRKVNT